MFLSGDGSYLALPDFSKGGVSWRTLQFFTVADGKPLWQTTLAEQNDILGRDLPLYDPAFPDHTSKLWPVSPSRRSLPKTARRRCAPSRAIRRG